MTRPFPFTSPRLRFYLTGEQPCPYLPERSERKLFANLADVGDPRAVNNLLTENGFRRSQRIAYRPACESCTACVSVRIPAEDFVFSSRWSRILKRNSDVGCAARPAIGTIEQFNLLTAYLNARHQDGGMADMTAEDFLAMVEESQVDTVMVEYRDRETGDLIACALTDWLADGLSMVYSFYDPSLSHRSLGTFMILDHIRRAQSIKGRVYLGYWVENSPKMGYKSQFQPLEVLTPKGWRLQHHTDAASNDDEVR